MNLPDHAWLEAQRQRGDPLADAVVTELVRNPGPESADLFAAVEARAPEDAACAALLRAVTTVPDWVDFSRMARGTALGVTHSVHSALSLLLGSLVESYASARAAKVLIRSRRLEQDTVRRLRDTATFALCIARSGGAPPGSGAHRHVVKVRLVHAFIRHGMLHRRDWDPSWGLPVNQEDYASTLLMFSHVYLRGLGRLGIRLSATEEDSVHHTYRWVGYLMGVTPELLTATRDEERALYELITRRQFRPDEDSRVLAHALIDTMGGRPPLFLPRRALYALSRHLIGDALADELAFPAPGSWSATPAIVAACGRLQQVVLEAPAGAPIGHWVGERVASAMLEYGLR
ncbi:MAG: DUF2236 domain-containing protein [Deltaproteobacteria bacterium]|nr:DUF2236 domain-containing protein [Deltaproteobacteria bacterium]